MAYTGTGTLAQFLGAIRKQESGGDYSIVNSSSGALGAYQVMPANVASWTKQALGYSMSPQQFLATPSAQDAVANVILGGYFNKYGAAGAAAMWYSGQPDPTKKYGDPPVYQYVDDVLANMGTAPPVSGSTSATGNGNGTADNGSTQQAGFLGNLITGSVGGDIAQGMEEGLTAALKAVIAPILTWVLWTMESALGAGLIGLGAVLVFKATPIAKAAENKLNSAVSAAVPEVGVAVAAKKGATAAREPAETTPAPKPASAPAASQKRYNARHPETGEPVRLEDVPPEQRAKYK
jgi:hypothetical protein